MPWDSMTGSLYWWVATGDKLSCEMKDSLKRDSSSSKDHLHFGPHPRAWIMIALLYLTEWYLESTPAPKNRLGYSIIDK